jgi:hypothetical protein
VLVADLGVRLPARARILAPSGWTLVRRDTNDPFHVPLSQALYYRVAGPSEPAAYTWKWPSAHRVGATGGIFAYRGVDLEAPVEAHSGGYRSKSTRIVAPSTVIGSGNAALLGFFGENGTREITGPASMIRRFDRRTKSGASTVRLRGATRILAGAGSTGDVVASISGNRSGSTIGQLLVLRPAQRPRPDTAGQYRGAQHHGHPGSRSEARYERRLVDEPGRVELRLSVAAVQRRRLDLC